MTVTKNIVSNELEKCTHEKSRSSRPCFLLGGGFSLGGFPNGNLPIEAMFQTIAKFTWGDESRGDSGEARTRDVS
mgnify:CR=1 FL=1